MAGENDFSQTRGVGIGTRVYDCGCLSIGVLLREQRGVVYVIVTAEEARTLAQNLLDDASEAEEGAITSCRRISQEAAN